MTTTHTAVVCKQRHGTDGPPGITLHSPFLFLGSTFQLALCSNFCLPMWIVFHKKPVPPPHILIILLSDVTRFVSVSRANVFCYERHHKPTWQSECERNPTHLKESVETLRDCMLASQCGTLPKRHVVIWKLPSRNCGLPCIARANLLLHYLIRQGSH